MGLHFRKECKHGTLVTQCRCMYGQKTTILVDCPPHCKEKDKLVVIPVVETPQQIPQWVEARSAALQLLKDWRPIPAQIKAAGGYWGMSDEVLAERLIAAVINAWLPGAFNFPEPETGADHAEGHQKPEGTEGVLR